MPRRPPRRSALVAALALAMAAAVGPSALAQAPAKPTVVYTIEQLRTGPLSAELQQKMVPMHTLAEIEALLKSNRIAFAWMITDVSADQLPAETAGQIAALPPKEVFVAPGPNGVVIGVVVGQK